MITQSGNSARKPGDYRYGPDSTGTPSSPHARAAAAIRARQIKSDATSLQSGPARSRVFDSRGAASTSLKSKDSTGKGKDTGEKAKTPTRLDAEGLQSYYSKGRRDFASYDLNSLNVPKANLSGATFHQANLSKINLQGANLFNADFGRANLNRANLRDATMVKAYMNNADLEGADLRGADLSHAYLLNANLRGANLCGANLTGAKLTEDQLSMARTNWMTVRPSGKRGMW